MFTNMAVIVVDSECNTAVMILAAGGGSFIGGIFSAVGGIFKIWRYGFGGNPAHGGSCFGGGRRLFVFGGDANENPKIGVMLPCL